MCFIHEHFLLQSDMARRLYHEVAAPQPIIDYHCHLNPEHIAKNRVFKNLTEAWLDGDHYKWRALRANGVAESLVTGSASPEDKFFAWAATVPMTLRNPLHHWTHLELARHFDIHDLLDERSASAIWEKANAVLATPQSSVQGILSGRRVEVVCTTDDPTDDLAHHAAIREQTDFATKVFPTFRPDRAMAIQDAEAWNSWVELLAKYGKIDDFTDFLSALHARHDFFHAAGGRLSDHGLSQCPCAFTSERAVTEIFTKARAGGPVTPLEAEQFANQVWQTDLDEIHPRKSVLSGDPKSVV